MSTRDLLWLVLANLNRMRARVALTAIGVVIGTAAVVLLVSLSVGLQANLEESMASFGDLTVIEVSPGAPRGDVPARGRAEPGAVLDDDALQAFRELPGVVVVTPKIGLQGMLEFKVGRDTTMAPYVQGIEPRAAPDMGWQLETGQPRLGRGQIVVGPRVLEDIDVVFLGVGSAAVVDETQATGDAGGAPSSLQGKTLTALLTRYDEEGEKTTRSERLHVTGVFEPGGGSNDIAVYMARADIEDYNRWLTGERRSSRDGYDGALVKVGAPEQVREVQAAINDAGYTSFSSQQIADELGRFFLIVRVVLGGVGAVALLVAAFGIANTMTMAIYERTREIGIMKAVGATNRDVLQIFLAEAGAIGALGGLFGALLAWITGKGINAVLQLYLMRSQAGTAAAEEPPTLLLTPLWLIVFGVGFAALVGLASGVYPALRAASMKPLKALRSE